MLLKTTVSAFVMLACSCLLMAQRRVIPVCPRPSDTEKLIGFEIKFIVPKDTVVAQGSDTDYVAWGIQFSGETKRFPLQGFQGNRVGNGEPSRDTIAASPKFTRRYWVAHNKRGGVDSPGTLKNGKFWRNFGMTGENVWYYDVPADAAAFFDRIFGTACFP